MRKILGLLSLAAIAVLVAPHAKAQQVVTPPESLAAQVRLQGFACANPIRATRDRKRSQPDRASWVLRCDNANYRIRLDPDMAAMIEPLP